MLWAYQLGSLSPPEESIPITNLGHWNSKPSTNFHVAIFPRVFYSPSQFSFFNLSSQYNFPATFSIISAPNWKFSRESDSTHKIVLLQMNSRELTLVSTATVFGALASALAIRFLFTNPKKQYPKLDSSKNGVVSRKCSSQSPFDPSKRKGLVPEMSIIHKALSFTRIITNLGPKFLQKIPTFFTYIFFKSIIISFWVFILWLWLKIFDMGWLFHGDCFFISWKIQRP